MTDATAPLGSVRRPVIVGCLGLVLLVGGFGGWAVAARLAGAIIAQGVVDSGLSRQVIQHPEGGVVTSLEVREGDEVSPGDLLMRLEPGALGTDLSITETRLFEVIARRARLEAERDGLSKPVFAPELNRMAAGSAEVRDLMAGQARLHAARAQSHAAEVAQLTQRAAHLGEAVAGLKAQRNALERQRQLILEELTGQETLRARGLVPAARVLVLRREAARLEGAIAEAGAQSAEAEGRIAAIAVDRLRLTRTRREEAITRLRDLRHRELELRATRRALRARQARLEIRAPMAGTVHGLRIQRPGAVLRAGDTAMWIVPHAEAPIIVTQVPPLDVDAVFVGQRATLRFPALAGPDAPELEGRVRVISADVFEAENAGARFYRAEIVLNRDELGRLPAQAALTPGMPVEVFIRTGDQTPLHYLTQPLIRYFTKAFRA